ncbi:YlbF family regulator [Chungangia koreensis]|uniref:UPF0342 protein ACFOZY_14140 n=1 Tax=Chungangia koreensis TaxID=752657 RepID=A0ABV8X6M0_9LACT
MVNIYDDINRLEVSFRKTPEFAAVQQAIGEVKKDPEALAIFQNFRKIQLSLQEQQMQGKQISGEELEYAQKTAQLAQQNPKIAAMLQAEMNLSKIIEEINRILMKPVQDLYTGM